MRDDQSKRNSNPGKDTTQWSENRSGQGQSGSRRSENQGQSSRDEYQGSSYGRMDNSNDDEVKNPGRSYRTDDYYNRSRVPNQGYSQGYNGLSDNMNEENQGRSSSSSRRQGSSQETPYEQASYGRDMSDNFSGGQSSRGANPSEMQSRQRQENQRFENHWNQNDRQSGFGQSNQQDQSYGQQYGRSSNQYTGSQSGQYGNSSYGSGSESYQPRGADQGSYGQDTGVNSRFQGGYPNGYDANNSQLGQSGRSQNQYDQSQYGRSHDTDRSSRQGMNQGASLRSQNDSENQYGQRIDQNYQGHFQGWDQNQQNYRGNDAQKSICGSAGFGSLGTGNEMLKARSTSRSENDHQDYNSRNSGMSFSNSYHPDAHYGQTSGSSSYNSNMDRDNLSGKQTPASYSGSGRQTPASYMGKGPKSFKRSDERIREEISETFTRHHDVDASDVEIEVKDGEVTLTGFVPERRMKYLAEDLAEKSMGVKDVTNNLRVRRETSAMSDISSSSDSMSASSDADKSDKKMNVAGSKDSAGKKGSTLNPNH